MGSMAYVGSDVDYGIVSLATLLKGAILLPASVVVGFTHHPLWWIFALCEAEEIVGWLWGHRRRIRGTDGGDHRIAAEEAALANWWVYLAMGCDGQLYCGISTDPERRVKEHNSSRRGAKWARAHRPLRLVYEEWAGSRGAASKRERQIKLFGAAAKRELAGIKEVCAERSGA